MRSAGRLRARHERVMRRADAIECDQIGLETLKQDAVWLKRATEVVAVAQSYLAVDCRQERPSVPLVLADDSFVGHRFEHAQKRTAIRIVAGQQGDLGDPFGDAATDAVANDAAIETIL